MITVTAAQAERLGSKLTDPSQRKSLDATAEGGKLSKLQEENDDLKAAERQALTQMAAQVKALQKENAAQVKALQKENAALKKAGGK